MSNEPEFAIDPYDGRIVPCVMCMGAPQIAGWGVCSKECEDALDKWIEEDENE